MQVLAVRKSGKFAWVKFSTIQTAHQALTLDGEPLAGGILKISQSKTPIHTAGWRAPVRCLQPCCDICLSSACYRLRGAGRLQAVRKLYIMECYRTNITPCRRIFNGQPLAPLTRDEGLPLQPHFPMHIVAPMAKYSTGSLHLKSYSM